MNSAPGNSRDSITTYAGRRLRETALWPSELGMSEDLDDLLGFDIEVARRRLVRWLIDNGLVTQGECDSIHGGWREEGASEAVADWATAEQIADVHGSAHYVVPAEAGVRPLECHDNPCRAAAVSFALFELCGCWKAYANGTLTLLKRVKAVKLLLDKISPGVLRHQVAAKAVDPVEVSEVAALILSEAGPSAKVRAARWLANIARLQGEAPQLLASLADEADIEHLRALAETRSGRRPQELLTVVCQLLDDGGFNDEEVAGLIPDPAPGKIAERAERVRQRVKKPKIGGLTPHPQPSRTRKKSVT